MTNYLFIRIASYHEIKSSTGSTTALASTTAPADLLPPESWR